MEQVTDATSTNNSPYTINEKNDKNNDINEVNEVSEVSVASGMRKDSAV